MNSKNFLDDVTPLILTFNESENISRTLGKLTWARRIIIVDSGSTDGTLNILSTYDNIDVFYREFDDFAKQCQFGLGKIETEWALSLDADYELSNALIAEMRCLDSDGLAAGFRTRFIYRVHGRPLRGSLYPPRTILYRTRLAKYRVEGHGHRVIIDGPIKNLSSVIYHDDRKPLSRWFAAQKRYAVLEAEHLLSADHRTLSRADRLRRMAWPAPFLVFFYVLLAKRCVLDGRPGWFYALQRLLAEVMLTLELIERRQARASKQSDEP